MKIEKISQDNINELTKLILELWTESSFEEEYQLCERILRSGKETCFLVKHQKHYIAFIYLAIRTDYVEGTTTSPVVYIEGLYVKPRYRKLGVGKKLVEAGEKWGKDMGCKEYASDTEWENEQSIEFHKRAGFKEVNRIICFTKEIK